MQPPVTFFYPYPDDLASLETVDLDDWRFWSMEWRERRRAWSLRTFLQLQRAGYEVQISAEMPREGIVVVGPEMEMRRAAARGLGLSKEKVVVVGIRADLPRCAFADIEVLQNGRFHDGDRFIHLTHWSQPGLVPRDPGRGTLVETIAFKGYLKNLHRGFASEEWRSELERAGFRMERGTEQEKRFDSAIPWHDYHDVDVVVALRPDPADIYIDKPASKLINAWRAGTPALLGPEHPFRELRRSDLDYIEVRSPTEVLEALRALRDNPALYTAMVENGRARAGDFTATMLTQQWGDLLFDHVQRRFREAGALASRLPVGLRRAARLVQAPPSRDEIAFARRWYTDAADLLIHGKLRPWFGQTRVGRLRRRLADAAKKNAVDASAASSQ